MGEYHYVDVHGAGSQRSDPKSGSLSSYTYAPYGYYSSIAPQGDAIRLYNCVRLVRTALATDDSVGDGIPDWWRERYFGGDGATTNGLSCATCDADGLRNGECSFTLRVCLNSTALAGCSSAEVTTLAVDHADDNGDPKFDPDFQAIQTRVNALGLPNDVLDECTVSSTIRVPLRAPTSGNVFRKNKKKLGLAADGDIVGKPGARDKDRMKLTCRPEGDGIYLPVDLYTGTFDRIRQQVFAQSCALSGCHDSESAAGDLILLSGAAYSQIVGVTPSNGVAAGAGLQRILPGDPTLSFLYRKITNDLEVGWGGAMPASGPAVSQQLIDIIELWILGDGLLGPAPETGWVPGTDQ